MRALGTFLSDREIERAARFRFPRDAERFIAGRGILRVLLSSYARASAAELPLAEDSNGKPFLDGPARALSLHFNVAHSDDVALYAVAWGTPVGVDVEHLRAIRELRALAESHFSRREYRSLLRLPERVRTYGFFCCWTRKEALLKATGAGVTGGLDTFEVSVGPAVPVRLLRCRGDSSSWSLLHLRPERRCVGALAVWGGCDSVRCWTWPNPE